MKKACFSISLSILFGLFSIFLFSTTGFLFNVSITPIYGLLGALVSSIVLIYYTFFKYDESVKFFLYEILFLAIFITICAYISNYFLDISYDGLNYHLVSVAYLKLGYNPIFHDVRNFASLQDFHIQEISLDYVEYFLKGYEILAANVYLFFNKLNLIKILKFLFFLMTFCYSFYTFKNEDLTNKKALLVSVLFIFCPICACQFLSSCVDDVVYYLFLIIFLSLMNYLKNIDKNVSLAIFTTASILFINTKLTCVFMLILLIFAVLCLFKDKKILISSFIILLFGILTGVNPYITNLTQGKNIFYPIVKDSFLTANREYMIESYPKGFESKNRFEKFFISLFAASQNVEILDNKSEPMLKIPFTITKYDSKFNEDNMRVGGFGYFFSGILLFAIMLSFFIRFEDKTDKKIFFLYLFVLIMTIIGNHESWWARFIPHFWMFPSLVVFYMLKNNKKIFNVLVLILSIICYINSLIIIYQYVSYNESLSEYFYSKLRKFTDNKPIVAFTKKQLDDNQNDQIYQLIFREYGFKTIYVKDENEIENLESSVTSISR